MRRRLLTFFSAFCILLWLTVFVLWVRSLRQYDVWTSPAGTWEVASDRGGVSVEWGRRREWRKGAAARSYQTGPAADRRPKPLAERRFFFPGFEIRQTVELTGVSYAAQALSRDVNTRVTRRCEIRNWLLISLLSLLPAFTAVVRLRKARRSRQGLCQRCGYDLRATPEQCPECGATPPPRRGEGL